MGEGNEGRREEFFINKWRDPSFKCRAFFGEKVLRIRRHVCCNFVMIFPYVCLDFSNNYTVP